MNKLIKKGRLTANEDLAPRYLEKFDQFHWDYEFENKEEKVLL